MTNKKVDINRITSLTAAAALTLTAGAALTDTFLPNGRRETVETTLAAEQSANNKSQPNIVFVLMDDTGARDLSCYGNTFNETPFIDGIAEDGMLFSNFYASPVCSPSRGALYSGNNPSRTMITDYLDNLNSMYLDPEEFTAFPRVLQGEGYYTGLLGKWHNCAGYEGYPTKGAPIYHGFEEVLMSEQRYIGPGYYYYPYYHLPQVSGRTQGQYLVDDMNDQALAFIDKAAKKDQPFFLMFSHYATHTTLEAPAETVNKYQKKRGTATDNKDVKEQNPWLAAMLEHVDDGVGAIDQKLEDLGIKDNTIFVIAADNGGSGEFTTNGELRGAKRQIHEGGIKDPLIIRWPEAMKASKTGRVIDTPVSIIDFYQTFCEAAGAEPDEIPQNSGTSMIPILKGQTTTDRDDLYWCVWRNSTNTDNTVITNSTALHEGAAIRRGNYKYIESQAHYRRELYDLASDPGETKNIIDSYPEIYKTLATALNEHLENDTVDKKFKLTFADKEYYRMRTRGTFTKSGGKYTANPGFNVMTVENWWLYDTESEVDVQVGTNAKAGIVLRANLNDPSGFSFESYAAVINDAKKTVELLRIKGDKSYVIASAPAPTISSSKTHRLKVKGDSDLISIYLDGSETPVLQCYDELLYKGTFGVFSEGSKAVFSNFSVNGFRGERPVSAKQRMFAPDDEIKIKTLNRWVWFDEPTQIINGEVYADLETLARELNIDVNRVGTEYTLTLASLNAKISVGQTQATVNNEATTVLPIIEKNGCAMMPLKYFADWFYIDEKTEGNTITLSSETSTLITDRDSRVKYKGTWREISSPAAYGGTTTRSNIVGDSAELTFTGMGIRVYMGVGSSSGLFEVYIDGIKVGNTIDSWNNVSSTRYLKFEKTDLNFGTHTIKIVNAGKHENNTGNMNIDAFEVLKLG